MSEVEKPTLLEDEIPQNFQIGKIRFTLFRLLLLLTLAGILGELVFFAWIWPDWAELHRGKVPASALIKDYQAQLKENPKLPALVWMPVQKAFPNRIKKAFILSEDSRFYEHGGVDFQAIQDAIKYNWKHGKILLGASTISQQTAKNMFLSLSRSPLRKGNELLLTWLLEARLSKAEILHIYLNIAEFGTGIFGIEAAARTYYHTSAYNLNQSQAAELAASLPSPKKHNPRTRTKIFQRHVARLTRTLNVLDQYTAQQPKAAGNSEELAAAAADLAKKLQELRELNATELEVSGDSSPAVETPHEPKTSTTEAIASPDTPVDHPDIDVPKAAPDQSDLEPESEVKEPSPIILE